jgi:hypothetical protein
MSHDVDHLLLSLRIVPVGQLCEELHAPGCGVSRQAMFQAKMTTPALMLAIHVPLGEKQKTKIG